VEKKGKKHGTNANKCRITCQTSLRHFKGNEAKIGNIYNHWQNMGILLQTMAEK
jgi:hypothetical protein